MGRDRRSTGGGGGEWRGEGAIVMISTVSNNSDIIPIVRLYFRYKKFFLTNEVFKYSNIITYISPAYFLRRFLSTLLTSPSTVVGAYLR